MIYHNAETENLLDMIGHDMPVRWRDVDSNITVTTTAFNMTCAISELKDLLILDGVATLEDFYKLLNYTRADPNPEDPRMHLSAGWCWECAYEYGNDSRLDIEIEATYEQDSVIFDYYWKCRYCDAYYDCTGCDDSIKDKLEGVNYGTD